VPCDAVNVNVHEGIEELKFVLVNVTILHWFIRQAIRQLKILHCDFCGFLKYNESIDVPSIEAQTGAAIIYKFCEKFEDN
jgi:hypothetical protein